MKKRELEKMRSQPREEMIKHLQAERERLQKLIFDLSLGKASNVRTIHLTKRTIAQLMTLLREQKHA